MAKNSARDIEVKAFATHQVITQPNPLRKVLRRVEDKDLNEKDLDDPVARAEQALAGLSGEFKDWMADEVNRLSTAYAAIRNDGFTKDRRDELFRAAHDIKGDAATFGFPVAADIAESLCRVIEHAPDFEKVPAELFTHHINAILAIVHDNTRLDSLTVSSELSRRLRKVADEYLAHVNRDRPEHLEAVLAPSIAPAE
jgi:chemotaxis protein histidine kinase CheA